MLTIHNLKVSTSCCASLYMYMPYCVSLESATSQDTATKIVLVFLPREFQGQRSLAGVTKSRTWVSLFFFKLSLIIEIWNYFPIQEYFFFYFSVQSLSHVWLFETPWTAAHQASLSIANPWNLLKLMSIKSVMPTNQLILCRLLLLLPSIFSSISFFQNWSVLCITWPKY